MDRTDEERPFIDQIMADPKAKDAPLVYADWLDEHGQADRARLIRDEIAGRPDGYSDDQWWEERHCREEFVQRVTAETFSLALCKKFQFEWEHGLARAYVRRGARPTPAEVGRLAGFPYLTEFRGLGELTPAALARLGRCPNVRRACLWGDYRLTPAHWEALAGLSQVERLSLANAEGGMDGLAHVAALSGLKELTLEDTAVGDAEAAHLAALTGLEVLDLGRTRVSDAGLHFLPSLTHLRDLRLFHTDVTDATLERLASLPRLTALDVGDTQVKDPIACILRLPRLQKVGLRRFTQITDANLPDLMRMPDLVEVDLRVTHVTRFRLAPLLPQTKWKKVHLEMKIADSYDAEQREIDAFEEFCKQHGIDADVDWE
jgi:uncharacterized protein (TIGR02996 family)